MNSTADVHTYHIPFIRNHMLAQYSPEAPVLIVFLCFFLFLAVKQIVENWNMDAGYKSEFGLHYMLSKTHWYSSLVDFFVDYEFDLILC